MQYRSYRDQLTDGQGCRVSGLSETVKKGFQICPFLGVSEPKKRLLGSKNGQNQGFAVTDTPTSQKCKSLILA
jgi:hypothetical protein